jgi:GR25 family glycosyltransferase involved in LPS biosynthesis
MNSNNDNTKKYNMNKYADKVFIINMDKDIDRLYISSQQCKKYNIEYERFAGIDVSREDIYSNEYISSFGKLFASNGMIGCGLSHIKLWEKIINDNIKVALILEDDFIIKNNIYNLLEKSFDELPEEWDVFFLTSTCLHNKNFTKFNINKEYIYSPLFINTTCAYFITLDGAKNLLKYANKIYYHIDHHITISNLLHDLKIYSITDAVIYQEFINSNNIKFDNNFPMIINNYLRNFDNRNYYKYDVTNMYIYYLSLLYIRCIDFNINLNTIIIFLMGYFNFNLSYLLLLYEHSIYYFSTEKLYMNIKLLLFGFICNKIFSYKSKNNKKPIQIQSCKCCFYNSPQLSNSCSSLSSNTSVSSLSSYEDNSLTSCDTSNTSLSSYDSSLSSSSKSSSISYNKKHKNNNSNKYNDLFDITLLSKILFI